MELLIIFAVIIFLVSLLRGFSFAVGLGLMVILINLPFKILQGIIKAVFK